MTKVYGNVLGMLGAIVFLMLCASTAQGRSSPLRRLLVEAS